MNQVSPNYRVDPRANPTFAPIGTGLRVGYLIMAVLSTLGLFGTAALMVWVFLSDPDHPDFHLLQRTFGVFYLTIFLVYGMAFIGMAWIWKAWSWLPQDQRYSRHWKGWITPEMAALFLLIPYFQYYWMFVIDAALCDAFDRLRVRYPTSDNAPKTLGILAGVFQLIIPLPVGAILWIIFMAKIERMTREMSAAATARGNLAF